MKRSLLAAVIAGSFILAGCSSSGGASGNNDNAVDRPQPQVPVIPDIDNSPEWGLDTGDAPERPQPSDPDWGLDMGSAPDRNPPLWGGPDYSGNTPDRIPPVWGGPEMPPIDNGPEAAYIINGNLITDAQGNIYQITNVNWHSQAMEVQDKDGNVYQVRIERQGIYEGDFTVFFNGQAISIGSDAVQGGLRPLMEAPESSIDRETIRSTIRSRLSK